MTHPILFRCPWMGMNVQHELDDMPGLAGANTLVSVPCPACASLQISQERCDLVHNDFAGALYHLARNIWPRTGDDGHRHQHQLHWFD